MGHSTKVAKESANKNQTDTPAKTITSPEQADAFQLEDLRDETITQRKLQSMMQHSDTHNSIAKLQSAVQNSPRSAHIAQLQNTIDNSPRMQAQRKSMDLNQHRSPMQLAGMSINDEPQLEHEADVMGAKVEKLGHQFVTQQRKEDSSKKTTNIVGNDQLTGFPNLLKAGFATLGHDINPTVHYNSTKPAQLNALAYAQGNDIHLGVGQEQHLPHEAWHVLQQKQGRVASNAQFVGQESTPIPLIHSEKSGHSQDDGITYTLMSDAAYADWRQTIQCKMGLHGAYSYGGNTVVTQYKNPAEVMQMISLGSKGKAILLVLEGALTIAAGIGAMVASGGVGVIPALIAVAVGVVKMLRAYATYKGKKTSPKVLRFIESGLAIAGGLSSGNPAIIVFAFAKLLRSILEFFIESKDGVKAESLRNKIIMSVTTVLHAVEVVALAIAGGANITGGGDIDVVLGGAAVAGVAASKGIRTVDQAKAAYEAKVEKKTEPEEPEIKRSYSAGTLPGMKREVAYVT